MKILIPIDKSRNSSYALAFASSIAAVSKRPLEIEIVTVLNRLMKKKGGVKAQEALAGMGVQTQELNLLQPTEELFTEALGYFKDPREGVKVTTKILYGKSPSEEIAREARHSGADLILMGARGQTPLQALLFGSVTSGVLAECKVPVMVLRDERKLSDGQFRVAIAVDGSKPSIKGIKHIAENLGLYKGCELSALAVAAEIPDSLLKSLAGRVIPQDNPHEYLAREIEKAQKEDFEAAFKPLRKQLEGTRLACREVGLVRSDPALAIADYVKENETDLLVIGSRGRGRVKAALMGSTASKVTAITTVPLLIIR
jgi:nucleotide-binding universal stress UspA family protein